MPDRDFLLGRGRGRRQGYHGGRREPGRWVDMVAGFRPSGGIRHGRDFVAGMRRTAGHGINVGPTAGNLRLRVQAIGPERDAAPMAGNAIHSSFEPAATMDKGTISTYYAVVDPELCAGCGICRDYCPEEAITVDNTAMIDPGKCTGCNKCLDVCPRRAISIKAVV